MYDHRPSLGPSSTSSSSLVLVFVMTLEIGVGLCQFNFYGPNLQLQSKQHFSCGARVYSAKKKEQEKQNKTLALRSYIENDFFRVIELSKLLTAKSSSFSQIFWVFTSHFLWFTSRKLLDEAHSEIWSAKCVTQYDGVLRRIKSLICIVLNDALNLYDDVLCDDALIYKIINYNQKMQYEHSMIMFT